MKKTWESLPPFAKGVIAVFLAALGAGAIYISYNGIKKYIAGKDSRKEITDLSNKLDQLANQGVHPTISQQQASSMANQLEAAFQGYGTDFDVVKRVFQQLGNDADVVMLLATFGNRTISSGTWNPEGDYTGTLSGAMTNELSSGQSDEINVMLQQKGISQRF